MVSPALRSLLSTASLASGNGVEEADASEFLAARISPASRRGQDNRGFIEAP